MKTGRFTVEGDIGNISKNIFNKLEEVANFEQFLLGNEAIEEAGGVPLSVRVVNNNLDLNKENRLLRSEITFEIK